MPGVASAAETAQQVKEEREQDTQEDGRPKWEEDSHVLAPPLQISGNMAKANPDAVKRVDHASGDNQQQSEFHQQPGKSAHTD